MPEITSLRISPLIPDTHPTLLQPASISVALQEPQQLIDDTLEVTLLGSDQRETLLKIETHLMAKNTDSTRTRTVVFLHALPQNAVE